jgi:hypothetical protein
MKCFNCIHYNVCGYHIDEETPELTVHECPHGFKHKDQYVQLPVYVGQPVWYINSISNYVNNQFKVVDFVVKEGKVSMLQQKVDKSWKFRVSHSSYVSDYKVEDLGTHIYTSPEEAEADALRRKKELEL